MLTMSDQEEFEGEIEFLDEDAEIVQQCVSVPHVENKKYNEAEPGSEASQASSTRMLYELLVERDDEKDEKSKRKRKHDDDDDDYDPKEDVLSPFYRKRKRRPAVPQNVQRERIVEFIPKPQIVKDPFDPKMDLGIRRKLQLKVPDYDDPLCLPVRALRKDPVELRKLRNWNNLCLEHFKRYDTILRVDKQPTVASKRIVVLKNLPNGPNGKVETTMSAKLCVENKNGGKRTEVTQSVLPRYREKKLLNIRLTKPKRGRAFYNKEEVILTKEVQKGEESLVVYKPKDSLSLVYKMCDNKGDDQPSLHEEEDRRCLKEVASCKVCAPCYQTSWRAFKTTNNNKKILCTICKRPCISMYNLLAHMKSHPNAAVRACKKEIAQCLATAVEYHYKCKICEQKFTSIKALRSHVKSHKGTDNFRCEVCNQFITNKQIIINKM